MNDLQEILERCEYKYEIIQHENQYFQEKTVLSILGLKLTNCTITNFKTDKGYFALILSGNVTNLILIN